MINYLRKTKSRILEGVVVGVTAGIILAAGQCGLKTWEDREIRENQREQIQITLYGLVDSAYDVEFTTAAKDLGTTHAGLVTEVISTLLSFQSSHLTPKEKVHLASFIQTFKLFRFEDAASEAAVSLGLVCATIEELEFEPHVKCGDHVRRELSRTHIEMERL